MASRIPHNPISYVNPPSSENTSVGSGRENHAPEMENISDLEYSGLSAEEQNSETENNYWLNKARDAYANSTEYVDAYYRKRWEDSLNAFNNEFPSDSKYNSPAFDKRSKLFRPKTRAIIRKIEAAAAVAYFSNSDVISLQSENPSDLKDVASADLMKEILSYHLTKTIPWYQTVTGGIQDALATGAACAHIYWNTKTKSVTERIEEDVISPISNPILHNGVEPLQAPSISDYPTVIGKKVKSKTTQVLVKDHPMVDLIPIENIRIDPAASWTDPVNSSPYIIHRIPMYVGDVKSMMTSGKWLKLSDGTIKSAVQSKVDTTYDSRNRSQGNPYDSNGKSIGDYEIVWVQRHIHREDDVDYDFYTLSDIALLTEPVELDQTVFHGKRPYVIGNCIIETHRPFPSSMPELTKGLQEEANEIANQRLDNVKFAMNKRWIVARNKNVDLASLIRNVPGGITQADSLDDIRAETTPDVTQSSYQEQDRINVDFDELAGNFGAGTVQNNKQLAQTASGMAMLNQSANVLVEYTLRTFTETFLEPILNQLVLLEKHYETDQSLLKRIGDRSKAYKQLAKEIQMQNNGAQNGVMGMNQPPQGQAPTPQQQAPQGQSMIPQSAPAAPITPEELLQKELFVKVNVGMGATSPEQKINKLISGMMAYTNIAKSGVPNLNLTEVGKEIFGALGYADGSRFVTLGDNPEVQQLNLQIMQLKKMLMDKNLPQQVKVQVAKENNQTKMAIAQLKEGNANNRKLVDHFHSIAKGGLAGVAQAAAVKTDANGAPVPQPPQPPQPQGPQQ